jgi:hypothetical protein
MSEPPFLHVDIDCGAVTYDGLELAEAIAEHGPEAVRTANRQRVAELSAQIAAMQSTVAQLMVDFRDPLIKSAEVDALIADGNAEAFVLDAFDALGETKYTAVIIGTDVSTRAGRWGRSDASDGAASTPSPTPTGTQSPTSTPVTASRSASLAVVLSPPASPPTS